MRYRFSSDVREHMGGPIRTMVNCAGVCLEGRGDEFDGPVHDLSLTAWKHTLDVNLTGSFLLSKYAVADMLKAGSGSVVHIASVGGNRFGVNNSAYSASKAGISGLVRSMATAYGPMNIRTNAVCPGPIETRMSQMAKATGEERENWLRRVPARRIGRAEEVADVAAFLCGTGATFVNGSLVYVDGGMSSA
jgi:NAD(P)-dependent dehydrogenase (short-subunit alcohol dehydrogenase family)